MTFHPHGWCIFWRPDLIGLMVIGDLLVALAYMAIPIILLWYVRQRPVSVPSPLRPLVGLFALFIVFCGAGHLIDILTIWVPAYWAKGWWTIGTATVSWLTIFALIPACRYFVRSERV